ncbi:hypothetical protein A2W24_06580 [Microgenomates group bacterium RBG_16_45_19]|nr:MAG: hypothetical protein A2W24_06580 [Microgenomates group bacterium RBG_16_45_19]
MTEISDADWQKVQGLLTKSAGASRGGRPRMDDRRILNGIFWVLLNGGQWSQLPKAYGAYVTCWRRFKEWESSGLWAEIWVIYLKNLDRQEQIAWMLAFLDGNFVPGKKGK